MKKWSLEELLEISDEQWDAMDIVQQGLILEVLKKSLEDKGFFVEYDLEHETPHQTIQ